MEYTENYELRKPESDENVHIEDFNHNADEIDRMLKDLNDAVDLLEEAVALLSVAKYEHSIILSGTQISIVCKVISTKGSNLTLSEALALVADKTICDGVISTDTASVFKVSNNNKQLDYFINTPSGSGWEQVTSDNDIITSIEELSYKEI